ncbi:hypothetical protein X943_002936 [Babesia divergens]|uniref:Uncharacterized protein n=1 Tax=Babesia divergens TaxID=32595 RepID=A0AAD9GJS9_BABDI|nr:hypothetical protein X943_002936 [Babesia divergens]
MLVTHLSRVLLQKLAAPPPRSSAYCHQLKYKPPGRRHISFWQPVNKPPDHVDATASAPGLYPKHQNSTSVVTKLWQSIKRAARIEEGDPDEQVTEYFQYSVERLMMHPGEFTFGKFAMYIEVNDDLSVPLKQLKLQRTFTCINATIHTDEILQFLTPREKESDSASVFSHQAKLQLAEAAKAHPLMMCHPVHKQHHLTIVQCTLKDVNDMLYHHDICKTDRTWYFRRLVLGRHLPTSYEEREYLSYQRPIAREAAKLFPETSSLEAAKIREIRDHVHYRKPPYVVLVCGTCPVQYQDMAMVPPSNQWKKYVEHTRIYEAKKTTLADPSVGG